MYGRADTACFHCEEPLPVTPVVGTVDRARRAFCCTGCRAAADWIAHAELGDYYRLRDQAATRVGTDTPDYAAWDRDDVLAGHAHPVDGGLEITVLTDGMRCAACAWLIDRALRREPGVLDAGANAVTGRIRIAWDPQRTRLSPLLARLAALGYRPGLGTGEARERERRHERNRWLLRLGIAGLGAMQAMMLAEALFFGSASRDSAHAMPLATRDFFRWVAFLVATPVVFYSGWPFIAGMLREWRGRRLGMDTLIAGSTLLAYFASLVETARGGAQVWFDAAVMFVFLLLLARMLEQRARSVASAQVDALARARPALATRERADGGSEQVPLAALAVGDVVRVAIGEAVPADGTLLAAGGFDEALLTGESSVVAKPAGAEAFAGSLCREQPARLRVGRVGSATRLSQLARLVEHAQAQRPPLARVADRIAAWFVAGLLVSALVVYAWWRMHEPARAFEVLLAVLVVSCPCALSLAIPTALAAANGALARLGVLVLNPEALDRLARVDRVVFDKTGTLGDGRPQRAAVATFDGFDAPSALRIAAALERDSGHPLAQAFIDVENTCSVEGLRNVPGHGIEGRVDGRHWRLGRAGYAAGRADDGGLWLGDGDTAVARFEIREAVRVDAAAALAALRAQGLALGLCSGDGETAVARCAGQLGIADAQARQTPEDKLAHVRAWQAQGAVVAMVGDGLNDAPVLAGADVSLALADGAALAQRAADCVIAGGRLMRVPEAIALARRTRTIVRQNLAWAVGYNLLALPLAASGRITPWLAALGMALSSLLVTLNALRLTRVAPR
jgi:Cu2+-exporting ATPase